MVAAKSVYNFHANYKGNIDGFTQDCGFSIANTPEILQCFFKPS